MQPSSLVFLVIIAVWAAYFVQYWVRRREHLATARSVDQFSESMRVLERRTPLPTADLSTPQTRSYAVAPARPARAQILVKRAASSEAIAEPPVSAHGSAGLDARYADRAEGRQAAREADLRDQRRAARRTRALIMLGALSTVLVAVPLVALGRLPLVTLLVPLCSIGVAVAWARATAVAEQRARRTAVADRHLNRAAVDERAALRTSRPAPAPAPARAREAVAEPEGVEVAPVHDVSAPKPELFDLQAVATATEPARSAAAAASAPAASDVQEPRRPLVDEDDIPLTWDPVPVPRPTYTMKSRATRPAPAAADLVGDADTECTAYEQEPVRRVAGA